MKIIYLIITVFLFSCDLSPIKKVRGNQKFLRGKVTYTLKNDWNAYFRNIENYSYTKDGFLLNAISIGYLKQSDLSEMSKSKIKQNMELFELAEIMKTELKSKRQYHIMKNVELEPIQLGNIEAVSIAFEAEHANGYETKHQYIVYQSKTLTMYIEYSAASRIYYDKYEPEFEAFLKTYKDSNYSSK